MIFNVAAVDTGTEPAEQVPWLFSNESGYNIGALVSSRTGIMKMEDPRLSNWTIQLEKGRSGHWLFPVVTAFIELATPSGCDQPIGGFAQQDPQGVEIVNAQEDPESYGLADEEGDREQVS